MNAAVTKSKRRPGSRWLSQLRRPVVALAVIFVLALTPKAVFFAVKGWVGPSPDEIRYLNLADNLKQHGELGMRPGHPTSRDPAVYPLFLSMFSGSSGPLTMESTWSDVPRLALYVQMVLSALSACLVYVLASRLGGTAAGWLAGLISASYVPTMLLPSRFLTETLTVFLLLTVMLLADTWIAHSADRSSRWYACLSGAAFAMLALTRAVTFPLILVTVIFVLWVQRRQFSRAAASVAIALAAFAVCYSPWVIRSQIAFGEPRLLPSKGASARFLAYHTAEEVDTGLTLTAARESAFAALAERLAAEDDRMTIPITMTASRYWEHAVQRMRIMLGAHPCLELPFPFAGQHVYASTPMRWFNYLWSLGLFAALLSGLVVAVSRQDWRRLHVFAIPFAIVLGYSLVHAIPRYQSVPYAGWAAVGGLGAAAMMNVAARAMGMLQEAPTTSTLSEHTEQPSL